MTHFRTVSELEGAANLVGVKEESMSGTSSEDEGGYSVEQLEYPFQEENVRT